MKGIILAGGKGTRLLPATKVVNKHMVPILNRPMIMYPIDTLTEFGITDIMIVSGGNHIGGFADFLGDGSELGINLTYRVQHDAGGIAQALGLAKEFAAGEPVAVILGDNVFDSKAMGQYYRELRLGTHDMSIYVKKVRDPERFGVFVENDKGGGIIVEKPKESISEWAVTGLYIYPNEVFDVIPKLKPSARGELEITDVNNYFLTHGAPDGSKRTCVINKFESFWSDAGTPESLFEVTQWAYGKIKA